MTTIQGQGGFPLPVAASQSGAPTSSADELIDVGKRFEQLLWAEMLSHTGLEKAFTQSGGEAASAFSRMIVESIAEDLAESHPLGLNATGVAQLSSTMGNGDE
ncbi:hypothetical protein [Hyphomonas atlantica corrig.]|uniref:hypothetical protein n=1 Tax=Hyphomonas atlantica TaxID=1280948 RepID=UPI002352B1A0|nr:hypothetical protein [Hyphomonas atlantica]